ncbi:MULTISPECIES: MerR family DNA-binding protein [unclassified Roseateles]|uniref:MerR family DNA-binding protein n=1 Tax=unclassified Roseateles TaxID=2626991 RepID=UPI0006F34659|nr:MULTISPECIES: MerR family DNA-binding protein [unclassified Roseateles]KQW45353.1 hypothetical protein ASC81_10520 [Pelomonas sp. Root405]KRA72197.1 hypothetical protein ASD88_10520 [Pelomonas sp. Root662]
MRTRTSALADNILLGIKVEGRSALRTLRVIKARGDIRRLVSIRRCRDFGFSIDQVRELVGLVDEPDRSCADVRDIPAAHLAQVRQKLEELKALEGSLSTFVCSCDTACSGGPAVDYTILEDRALPADKAQVVRAASCCG